MVTEFEVTDVILHVILKQHLDEKQEPELSKTATTIDDDVARFLQNKFTEAFESAQDIARTDTISPVPELVENIYTGAAGLVEASQHIARHLQCVQKGNASDGLLMVSRGKSRGKDALLIAKLEHEQGVRANMTDPTSYSIEIVPDLFMTQKTKVFKLAVFPLDPGLSADTLRGKLCDTQLDRTLASYFLRDFLGCDRARQANVLTQQMYKAARTVLGTLPVTERGAIFVALASELQSNAKMFETKRFIHDHVPVEHQDAFSQVMERGSIPANFHKDISLIENDLSSLVITHEDGTLVHLWNQAYGKTVTTDSDGTIVNSPRTGVRPAGKLATNRRIAR